MEEPFRPLLSSLSGFFGSSNFSDGVVQCADKQFKIHKVILCAQSSFFSKAYNGDWKESQDGLIHLKDDDVFAVEAMLQFLYTFDYDEGGGSNDCSSPMVFNVKVYSLADKYGIPALQSLAQQKFEKLVKTCWAMDDFPHAIDEVYASTPSSNATLRQIVVDASRNHIKELLSKQTFVDVLETSIGFAADMVQQLAQKDSRPDVKTYKCPNCKREWEAVLFTGCLHACMCCNHFSNNWGTYVID